MSSVSNMGSFPLPLKLSKGALRLSSGLQGKCNPRRIQHRSFDVAGTLAVTEKVHLGSARGQRIAEAAICDNRSGEDDVIRRRHAPLTVLTVDNPCVADFLDRSTGHEQHATFAQRVERAPPPRQSHLSRQAQRCLEHGHLMAALAQVFSHLDADQAAADDGDTVSEGQGLVQIIGANDMDAFASRH